MYIVHDLSYNYSVWNSLGVINMRYVVIGGSGFLGQEIVKQLINSFRSDSIVVVDIQKPLIQTQYFEQDITEEIKFKFQKDDVVIHLAANQYHGYVSKKNREFFFEHTNSFGTENILKKMDCDGARKLIFFSTDMVYGKPLELPVTTDHVTNPFGDYGKSKVLAEEICKKHRDKGFNITIFRPRLIIGEGRLGIFKKLFQLIDLNLPVPMIGSGKNYYQMVSVIDCAEAAIKAIQNGIPDKEYNLGSKELISVKTLLKNLIRENNSKSFLIPTYGKFIKFVLYLLAQLNLEIMYDEQYMIADENYVLDISKTEEDLDWHPKYSDSDMLCAAYKSFKYKKEHKENI